LFFDVVVVSVDDNLTVGLLTNCFSVHWIVSVAVSYDCNKFVLSMSCTTLLPQTY